MSKVTNLTLAAVLASAASQVSADLVTINYEGYISDVYAGVADSKLGLGLGDTFSGSVTLDTANYCCSGPGYEGGAWYSYIGGSSGMSLTNTGTSDSMSSGQSYVFVENDYALTADDITWLDSNYPGHGATVGTPDDYIGFGGDSSDSIWNEVNGNWDYGYEFEVSFDFFSSSAITDNTLPDFSSLNPSDADLAFFYLFEEVEGSRVFEAEGVLTSFTYEVTPVPVPAAVWLFGSGLLGLVGVARHKKAA